jgi:deoxyuridine 5'-triphosphate nucleotidohydrolase
MSNIKEKGQELFNILSIDEFQCYLLGYIINTSYIETKNNEDYDLVIKLNSGENMDKLIIQIINNLLDTSFWNLCEDRILIKSNYVSKNYLYLINPELLLTKCDLHCIYELNTFPNLYQPITLEKTNNHLFWVFIRGYIEKSSTISFINNIPKCIISFTNKKFMNDFLFYMNIPNNSVLQRKENLFHVEYSSTNCIDLLGLIYKNKTKHLFNKSFYKLFESLINWKNICHLNTLKLDTCKIYKSDPNAIIPSKGHESDVGYDLTIIKIFKQLTPSTILYDTGIKLNVDYGYYIEIVPRSSLSKSGYMLSNSVGIIEKSYSGNLLVSLTKIDKEMPDLVLPFKCCQLIFKPQISLNILEMSNTNSLENTSRNNGGFGSTNL